MDVLLNYELPIWNGVQDSLSGVVIPYGVGGASDAIVQVLEQVSLENILKKEFFRLGTVWE